MRIHDAVVAFLRRILKEKILQRVCYCAAKRQFSFLHRKSCDVTDKHELKTLGTYF